MKAIRVHEFGGPEVLKLEDVPDLKPGAGQVVVRIKAVGVNPVETYIRAGIYPNRPPVPYTPGMDGAGIIESVGSGVKNVKAGDRVYVAGSITGTYAEQALCLESQVHPLPENVSFAQGAGVFTPYGTAYRALFIRGGAKPAERVLVHGATGGVGIAAVQLARAAGMIVYGTGGTKEGLELAKKEGAHHVLNHHEEGYLDKLRELTGGTGVDLILEMLANVNLGKDLQVLDKRGRVVVIGSRGTVEINPRDGMGRDASILAMSLLNATPEELEVIHAALGAGLANGTLRPVVDEEIPLAEATRAHKEIMESGSRGKLVLIP
ncbi:MAG TPA: NADPH:quinone reductase [Blastocatellia bacterium]|nr:NADPH:quinone reductase [Blastocatellia bacterium]